jgi:hypothetical protein
MRGQTLVRWNPGTAENVFYSGLGGNYAILNTDAGSNYSFDTTVTGVDQAGCQNQSFESVVACFILGTGPTGRPHVSGRLMTSQTTINGQIVYELPVLYYGGVNINGDTSGNFDNRYLLKFWSSKNLNRGTSTTDGNAWNLGNYQFNPQAQVNTLSPVYNQYRAKVLTLAGSGTNIPSLTGIFATGGDIYLQKDNIFGPASEDQAGTYPEGKTWSIKNPDFRINPSNGKITYHGIGTLIIQGNFTLGNNISIVPQDPAKDRLGIIVLKNDSGTDGNCTFGSGSQVTAMVFCQNTLTANNNSLFIGSFVANDFTINGDSLQFVYDPAFDDNQPPGFRNLILPTSTEVGNKN